jgi:hypothetical protein
LKIAEPTLKNDMQNLLFNPMLSDITFEVEKEEIKAHKIILASRCEYFKALCTGSLQESEKVQIQDTRVPVFKGKDNSVYIALLEFVYTDDVQLD